MFIKNHFDILHRYEQELRIFVQCYTVDCSNDIHQYGSLKLIEMGGVNMSDLLHRKSKVKMRIVDSNGNPLQNQKVKVQQTKHEFLFGCGAFDPFRYIAFDEDPEKEKVKERVDMWVDLYNYGTVPVYWGFYEKEEGKFDPEKLRKTAEYLSNYGVKIKGHPLCWHSVCPEWLLEYDNKTIYDKQIQRIQREVTEFKGLIDMWDVINEVVIMPEFDKYDNAITRICKDHGRVGLIKEVFEATKEANPDATLLLNDFNMSNAYEILIDGCLEAGVPIDAIGLQSHQHQGAWSDEKIETVLKRFGHFGLPIHFTENTFISGELMPAHYDDLNDGMREEWPSTEEGEERQKNDMEHMYRVLFEHPLVEAITSWEFVDGMWLNAPSGLLRKDNSKKPAYDMMRKLIKDEWWTSYEATTDDNGYVVVEGFKGEYKIQVGATEKEYTLTKDSKDFEMVVK